MSRYQKEITQCVLDNKVLKLKINNIEESVLKYMVQCHILEKKIEENSLMLDKIYKLLSNEISELNESISNASPIVSSNSDN